MTGFVDMRPVMTSKYASDLGRDALSACAKPRTAQHVVVHPRNAGCGGLKETRPASREGFRAARNSPISAVTIVCGFSPGRRLLPQGERGQGVRWPSHGLAGEPGPAPSAGLSAQGGPSGPAAVRTADLGSASSSSSRSGAGEGTKRWSPAPADRLWPRQRAKAAMVSSVLGARNVPRRA